MYLDTHAAVWLAAGQLERFSPRARLLIDEHDLLLSPIVLLEMQFLKEIGRLAVSPGKLMLVLSEVGVRVCDKPFETIVLSALACTWTRNPFDRIIVAHAALDHDLLLSKDRTVLGHYKRAVWDN
jgi:PIN domain nuclease of toxin-antitoxin system